MSLHSASRWRLVSIPTANSANDTHLTQCVRHIAPLLLAIMACGATYSGERAAAVSMYSVAMRLIFEVSLNKHGGQGFVAVLLADMDSTID